MTPFSLSFPRLHVGLMVPDEMAADIRQTFRHSIRPSETRSRKYEFVIRQSKNGFDFLKNGQLTGRFGSCFEMLCRLEEAIENLLIRAVEDWVAFHAGAVNIQGTGCLIAGDPDTGKTTTTLNLIEMGQVFLCEEVAPVEPDACLVHPHPQVLTLSRAYAEIYRSSYPVRNGTLKTFGKHMARYYPSKAGPDPVQLKTILIPSYAPGKTPGIDALSAADVFTELLGYCFPPNGGEEHLFDAVIKICENVRIFRVRSYHIESMRRCLQEIFDLE